MNENTILIKLEELEKRVEELEKEICTISEINQSERVREYIKTKEREIKIASLIGFSSDKENTLISNVEAKIEEECQQDFRAIPQINNLQSAKEYVSNVEKRYLEEIEKSNKISENYNWDSIFEYTENNGELYITAYIGFDEAEVIVPEEINGKYVVSIGDNVFKNCKELRKVILPEGLKNIGEKAFHFSGLQEINLPETLETVGARAFAFTNLKEICIPAGVRSISKGAFCDDLQLEIIILKKGLKTIEENAFDRCKMLQKIDIPITVNTIGEEDFKDIGEKHKDFHIRIPDTVIEIYGMNDNLSRSVFGFSLIKIFIYCNPGSYAMKYARKMGISVRRYEEFDLLGEE